MPISQQLYRSHVGNYNATINKKSINQAAQQMRLNDLAKYPGDAGKRVRAELMLQSLLMISNISLATGEEFVRSHADRTRKSRSLADLVKTPHSPLASLYNDGVAPLRGNHSLLSQRLCWCNRGTKKGKSTGRHKTALLPKQISKPAPLSTSALDTGASASNVLNRGKNQRQKKSAVRQTEDISRFLEKYYGKGNNVVSVIDNSIHYIINCPNGLADISLRLMRHSGEYGSHARETLSAEQQYAVVRRWISAQVFDKSIGEFIGRVIVQAVRENACNNRQPLKLPNEILFSYIVGKIGIHKRGAAKSVEEVFSFNDAARNYLCYEVLFEELPCLALSHDAIDNHNLYAGTVDWGYLHAGLVIAGRTEKDISQFSIDNLIELGSSLEDMLREGAIDAELVRIFFLPAMLLYIKQHAEHDEDVTIEKIFRSEEGNVIALEAFFAASERQKYEENPYSRFNQALRDYRTRTQLREMQAASDAGADNNLTALNDKVAGPLCLNAVRPSEPEPADADRLFNEQNEDIAAKYAVVDMLMVALAFEQLQPEEIDFLRSATIYRASADFSAFDNIRYHMAARVLPRHSYTVSLSPAVDLFAASRDGDKRIYALQYYGERYGLSRVDYDEKSYYELMADSVKVRRDKEYKLRVYDNNERDLLKSAEEPLEQLAGRLIQKHRNNFLHQLHEHGYEETAGEKAQRFLLSLIPFHDCISGIVNQKNDAPLSCALDMILLLPLAGQGLGLASRFAQHGFKGGIAAYRSVLGSLVARETLKTAVRQGSKEFIRHGIVPAAGELNHKTFINLGVAALRSVDPGLEIAGIIGTQAFSRIAAAANLVKEIMPAWKKILPDLETVLLHREPRISAEYIETARLPGRDKALSVRKLHGARYNRQPVYVQVDPVTGNVFGKKYTLSSTGILQTVPKPMAQRLKNILEVGLSGRGNPRSAAHLAGRQARRRPAMQDSPPVTVNHLLRWMENIQRGNPMGRDEFMHHFGLGENVWSVYVMPSGALTVEAQALLRQAGIYEFNILFTLSPEMQREIIQYLDIGPLQNLLRAFPTYENEHVRAVSLRAYAVERLELLQQNYARVWGRWLAQYFPVEKRWLAWERLNLYFERNDRQLILRNLRLSDLPARLPEDILNLDLSGNRLTHITPPLSENILNLDISNNFMHQLPYPLPPTLCMLDASYNILTQITPALSQSLTFLDLSHNMLTSFPVLPEGIVFLDVSNNCLPRLSRPLPKSLTRLAANNNQLTILPDLPEGLTWLEVRNNQLRHLPSDLPPDMTFLDLANNKFVSLPPILPKTLKTLDATGNLLVALPFLPPDLEDLFVSENLLTAFSPLLPPKLKKLYASRNFLKSTPPNLPPDLKELVLNNNLIVMVHPNLPSGLRSLRLTDNLIIVLPQDLPPSLQILLINRNPITRLPDNFPPSLKEIDVTDTEVPGRPANLPQSVNFIQNG